MTYSLFTYTISPVLILTTFWNAISWKCFLKDDCVRSNLIESQSFLDSKKDVDPIYRVLMSCLRIVQVLCTKSYNQVNLIKILVTIL